MKSDFLTVEDLQGESVDARETLMVLLDRLVLENGAMGTADKLGVNYKTLAAALETRRLSRRMTHVLEIQLLSEDNPVLQLHDDRIKALDERMDKLEDIVKEVVAGAEGLRASVEANRAEQDRVIRILERRIGGDAPSRATGLESRHVDEENEGGSGQSRRHSQSRLQRNPPDRGSLGGITTRS